MFHAEHKVNKYDITIFLDFTYCMKHKNLFSSLQSLTAARNATSGIF